MARRYTMYIRGGYNLVFEGGLITERGWGPGICDVGDYVTKMADSPRPYLAIHPPQES